MNWKLKCIIFYLSLYLYDNGELGNLSLTGFNVDISRHYSKYLIVYYLPSGLFVVVSWTSFIIPPQIVAGRMGLLVTILLCLVNIFNVVNNNSPSVKVDKALILSQDIISIILLCSMSHYLAPLNCSNSLWERRFIWISNIWMTYQFLF